MSLPAPIKKLNETVVNRIAAGEVIQRPANAIKELLENSLDAQSTNINVILKGGGLKLLQIQDNGTGIRKDDLEIVCERFTTSKLRQFDDLNSIATFGFRGEALASISHIAHLTITTKTADQPCAFKASYVDGKLTGPPKMCAGNQGTIISAEDLFYNVSTRRRALKSASDEYARVSEVISKYSIQYPKVGFSLKKQGEMVSDIKTNPNSTHIDNIRTIYGNIIARELLPIETKDDIFKFKVSGYISNANYNTKKQVLVLFINNRLVDSQGLRKALESVYSVYLPKGTHPFAYLSLELDPRNVDVNVHPTKHEVHFLHEEAVIENIKHACINVLAGANSSRTFYVQSKLPGVSEVDLKSEVMERSLAKANQNSLIRTDSSSQKLDKFLDLKPKLAEESSSSQPKDGPKPLQDVDEKTLLTPNYHNPGRATKREIKLTSILSLRKAVETECNLALRSLIATHSFVGSAAPHNALIQSGTELYYADSWMLLEEYFYQAMLYDFGNFGVIMFKKPLPLDELILIGIEDEDSGWTAETGDKHVATGKFTRLLNSKAAMLRDYFSIEIEDGNIKGLPLLLDGYFPDMCGLPHYLLRLAHEVDWSNEKNCFKLICRETAMFYARIPILNEEEKSFSWIKEHIVYPALKASLLPPKELATNGALLKVADLKMLYKVFERC